MILRYNECKGAVDTVDKEIKEYSCKRGTRRWPLVLFLNMIDIAAKNAYVLYTTKFPYVYAGKNCGRRLFLQELDMKLVTPQITVRSQNLNGLKKSIIEAIKLIIPDVLSNKEDEKLNVSTKPKPKKGRCVHCPRSKDTKIKGICHNCQKFVCQEHSKREIIVKCTSCNSISDSD